MRKIINLFVAVAIVMFSVNAIAEVGYAGGFFMKSDDGEFKLQINGMVQPYFFYKRWKEAADPDAYGPQPTVSKDQLSFGIRRTNLYFSSNVGEHISFGLGMFHATGSDDNLRVIGGSVSYEALSSMIITAGMVGLPLDLLGEMSSSWMLLTEWPVTTYHDDYVNVEPITRTAFGSPSGLGLNFAGDIWKFFYSLSVVNGNEDNYAINPDKKMSFGGKFGFNILDPIGGKMTDFGNSESPKLTVNVGSDYQGKREDPSSGAQIGYIWTSTMGVGFRYKGFSITTEGYYRRTKVDILPPGNTNPRTKFTDIGYYAAAGYYVLPKKLELAAQASQIIRQGPDNDVYEFGGGINYYIWENNLKMQLSYDWVKDYGDIWGRDANKIHKAVLSFLARF